MQVQAALFEGRSWVSRAIRWQTRSRFSHFGWWLSETREIIEAWHVGGVRRGSIDEVHTPGTTVKVFNIKHPLWDERAMRHVVDFCMAEIGKPYDFRSVFRFLSRRDAVHRNGWFCSALGMASTRNTGVDLLLHIPPEHVSPGVLSYSPLLQFDHEFTTKEYTA